MKHISLFAFALLALTIFGSRGAAAQSQTAPTPAIALPAVVLPTLARHMNFELREKLPNQPSRVKSGPHPDDTSPSACECVYGPPGSGVRVCGCYCDAGTACVPGDNSCQECSIYHKPM